MSAPSSPGGAQQGRAPAGRPPPPPGRPRGVGALDERRGSRRTRAVGRRVLEEHAEDVCRREVERSRGSPTTHLDAERLGAGLHHVDRLRMAVARRRRRRSRFAVETAVAQFIASAAAVALVEQRGVGDRQAGEVRDHRLEVEQRLEAALRDLGLVGRVLRVPARVLEDVALDHRRRDAAVVAHADEGAEDPVRRRRSPRSASSSSCSPSSRSAGRPAGRAARRAGSRPGPSRRTSSSSEAAPTAASISPDLRLARPQVAADEGVGGAKATRLPEAAVEFGATRPSPAGESSSFSTLHVLLVLARRSSGT